MSSINNTFVFQSAFGKVGEETLDSLRRVAARRTYPAKTVLCRQGATEHTFYIVIKGTVAIVRRTEDGEEQLLAMRGPNHFFGEMSLLDDAPRFADCVTVTETTVIEINEDAFNKLTSESPTVAGSIMRRVMAMARENDQRLIKELQGKQDALEKAYTALQAAQADLLIKERMAHELQLAADMQRTLLPDNLPHCNVFTFAAHLQTAREVGGDFYDVAVLDDNKVGVMIADVADKGVHAALFMAVGRTLFIQAMEQYDTPSEVVSAVHRGVLRASENTFVTAFYGILNRTNGRLRYVRAGHERPLLYRANGAIEELVGNGRFLGMMPDIQSDEHEIDLHSGDRLLLFSDGVPDTVNDAGEVYGNGRLHRTLATYGHLPAAGLMNALSTDIEAWMQNASPVDDITILVIEVN